MSESVSELVGRCRAGERAAESALAHRAASQALRTASVAMDDLDAARDVSQEVAVRVLRGISGLRAPERFDAWVFRITVSEIRRSYGRTRRRAEVSLDAQGENCELAGAAVPARNRPLAPVARSRKPTNPSRPRRSRTRFSGFNGDPP